MAKVKEIWKDVPGYEGLYQISTHARVKSLTRKKLALGKAKTKFEITLHGRILKQTIGNHGYPCVGFSGNGQKRKTCTVHRLFMRVFVDNPDGLPHVNHINCNRADNRLENLEWCTQAQNMRHAASLGRMGRSDQQGEAHPRARLTNQDVFKIREIGENLNGRTYAQVGKEFGINCRTVGYIIRRKLWKHI